MTLALKKGEFILSKAGKEMESASKIMNDLKSEIEGIQRRIKL
jgi:archaellum component FlaC